MIQQCQRHLSWPWTAGLLLVPVEPPTACWDQGRWGSENPSSWETRCGWKGSALSPVPLRVRESTFVARLAPSHSRTDGLLLGWGFPCSRAAPSQPPTAGQPARAGNTRVCKQTIKIHKCRVGRIIKKKKRNEKYKSRKLRRMEDRGERE